MEGGRYFTDVSLPFSMRWVASACQDTTSLVVQHLNQQGESLLSYIDTFGVVASTKADAQDHFGCLQALLSILGLEEANHKASPPSQQMI